ncbi:MAG: acetate--CoA ligase family protein [Nitrospinae bacterium]|nr:acetate--CoA ligase family protein [Nitrospinota bacterium]
MLEPLLYPESVAVIGASKSPGKVGYEILNNLVKGGFAGELIPVNPTADEIMGVKCFPDITKHEGPVDLSVIAVPTAAVKAAVEGSIKAGVKAIIVITAGFKETGHDGAELEKEIAAICAARNVRIMGPNCLGLINTHHKFNASFARRMPHTGGISVISQSGALCTAILDWAAERHTGLAKLISFGNKADLNESDFLRALGRDEDTRVIMGYLENITNGDEFIKVAEDVANRKPVVLLKVGSTKAGMKAASSHTGSLAGADIAYGAAFKRAGVIRVETFEALFDYSTAFSMQPLPKGDRVAIITNAGGPGIMAADAVEKSGMKVTTLGIDTASELSCKLPAAASIGNPIDVLGDADPERYALALRAAQEDDTVDAIIVILTPQAMTKPAETARALAGCVRGEKPILAAFMGGADVLPGREELAAASLPDYPSPERAVAALKAMHDYVLWRKRPPRIIAKFPVNRRRVERIITHHMRANRLQIGEVMAKEILKAYGFNVPEGQLAANAEEALDVADRIGYPVAMKIASPDIIHKSDFGGVRLGLINAEAVTDAFDLMMARIKRRSPDVQLEGVYVEKMATRGREVIVGMTRDPQFGPMLMFGLGGIFVEVMKDVTFYLAPITAEDAMQMLKSTRSYALLKGARGQRPVDLNAIAQGLQRISQLATDFPQIAELDINPFIVGEVGAEPTVADARITLSLDVKP